MELEEIYRQDLSLLIALQVLVEECSVTKAAKRLHLSQSATSRILGRLREMLHDPLFSRIGQQLVPTQYALDCYQQLQGPTGQLLQLLTPTEFIASKCQQKFTIATTDFAIQSLLPFVLPKLYKLAPNIRIEVIPIQHKNLQSQLSLQGVDIAICRAIGQTEPLTYSPLGQVGVSCLVSNMHPLANTDISMEDYLHYPHATIAISDGVKAIVDAAIDQFPQRTELLRAPNLDSALALLEFHPLIITLPEGMAELAVTRHDLIVKSLPFEIASLHYNLFWHPRSELDQGHRWLREMVIDLIKPLLLTKQDK